MWKRAWTLLTVLALTTGLLAAAAAAQGPAAAPGLARALAAQERATEALLDRAGVVGTAVTVSNGRPAVAVLTARSGVAGLPRTLDGVDVVVRVTGPISALHHRPGHGGGPGGGGGGGGGVDPTSRFARPVPIGVSTGNEGECSAGTIGARVRSGSAVYALSNNHVYALENQAPIGSRVLQPGRYDTGCSIDPANVLGNLSSFVPITFSTSANNRVDAAIAVSDTARLGNATPSNGYGTPQSATVSAAVGQSVQKYGRTTSLTQGTITMVNATVNVGYGSGTARFVGQVIVESSGAFIRSGDSGSLLVTSNRNPVGLLFAGSQTGRLGVANRIQDVLSAFGVSVDGT
jgi:hypothetical protein